MLPLMKWKNLTKNKSEKTHNWQLVQLYFCNYQCNWEWKGHGMDMGPVLLCCWFYRSGTNLIRFWLGYFYLSCYRFFLCLVRLRDICLILYFRSALSTKFRVYISSCLKHYKGIFPCLRFGLSSLLLPYLSKASKFYGMLNPGWNFVVPFQSPKIE